MAKIQCLRSITPHEKPLFFPIGSKQPIPDPSVFFSRRQKVRQMNPLWSFLFSYGNRSSGERVGTKKKILCSLRDSAQGQQEWSCNKVRLICEGAVGGLELHGLGCTRVQMSSMENLVLPEVGCMRMCEFSAEDRQ